MIQKSTIIAALTAVTISGDAYGLEGSKVIYAELSDNSRMAIGNIEFQAEGEAITYRLDLDETLFSEHFLSMRPFKCLDLEGQTVCHLPYPYDLAGRVEPPDWRDLDYRLLFLFKGAGEYGISFVNGYYFRFAQDGERLVGVRHETDMDQLASPPPDDILYPLDENELYLSEGGSHQLRRIVIE